MAERDKDALDADVESSLAGSKLHWVTRRGSPHSLQDLELVAAAHAKTVILLHPEADGVRWLGVRNGHDAVLALTSPGQAHGLLALRWRSWPVDCIA